MPETPWRFSPLSNPVFAGFRATRTPLYTSVRVVFVIVGGGTLVVALTVWRRLPRPAEPG